MVILCSKFCLGSFVCFVMYFFRQTQLAYPQLQTHNGLIINQLGGDYPACPWRTLIRVRIKSCVYGMQGLNRAEMNQVDHYISSPLEHHNYLLLRLFCEEHWEKTFGIDKLAAFSLSSVERADDLGYLWKAKMFGSRYEQCISICKISWELTCKR